MRRALIAAAFGLTVVVVPVPTASATTTATVPVIVCPTSLAISSPQTPVASSVTVPASAAGLVLYSATSAYIQILGPKNLACQAGIGADGTGTITALPAHSDNQGIRYGGIEAVAYPTCMRCLLILACPFFPAALKAARHDGYSCPVQPLGQVVHRLSSHTVAFSDPPGEYVPPASQSLVPSDSRYPTNGVVVYASYLYRGRYPNSTAMEAVCVLPASDHGTCTAVLNEFLTTQVKKFT